MRKAVALAYLLALASCSRAEQREDEVRMVERAPAGARTRVATTRPVPVLRDAAAATTAPAPAVGLETPMPVRGNVTDTPLPPELAHLNGLGGTSTREEERVP